MSNPFHIANPNKIFYAGAWHDAHGGQFHLTNPHTEDVFISVAQASEQDADAVVASAVDAFTNGPWPRMTAAQRAEKIRALAAALGERQADLEQAFIQQVGGLATFAPFAVGGSTATMARYADIAESYAWEEVVPSSVPGHEARICREAVGVVAAIAPWNMPYSIMVQKVAPALAAGCSVIIKPSPETPLEAYIIAECAEKAGLPAGVVNLLPADRDVSDYLVRHSGVDKISFTGSTIAGRRIGSVAADRMARVTLELGGKSPAIVLEDTPVEMAADILAGSACMLTGQVCALLSRVIVPESMHDALADAIAQRFENMVIGDPSQPTTMMGPIAMGRQLERVQSYIKLGVEEGATLRSGGERPAGLDKGFYIQPTLFSHVKNSMRIAQEEIFGPVVVLIPYRDLDHAIDIANDTLYGLNASVITQDSAKVTEIGRRIRSGNVAQNGLKADFELPFGGFKQSGVGREGGVEGIQPYTETKIILTEV